MRHRIVFWADAGSGIGYGHFVRSLALADMLKDNFDCIFYTSEPSEYQCKEAESVCRLESLNSGPERFSEFLDKLRGDEIVVLDNYFFSSDFQKSIKERGCKLVVIDEMHDKHYYADAIISPCLEDWSKFEAEPMTAFCFGPEWALLRKPFRSESETPLKREGTVICFGGADPLDLSGQFARKLAGTSKISVVIGDAYNGQLPDGVEVLKNLSAEQMAGLFRNAAKVYCSASGTCYEALSCGAEVHAGYYVENQKEFYELLKSRGLIYPMGDLSKGIEESDAKTADICFHINTANFVNLFKGLAMDCINFTELTDAQSHIVWETRNLDEIRNWMTNPGKFSFESHNDFISRLHSDTTKLHFAFFDEDVYLGTYNFNGISDSADRGLYVNPAVQGKGTASAMEILLDNIIKRRGVRRLEAEVLKINGRSINFHKKAGYSVTGENDRFYYFSKTLI